MRWTLYTHTLPFRALPPTSITINGIRSGSVVDTNVLGNAFRSALFMPYTGAVTDGTFAFTVQDSDDGTTFTDLVSSQIQGSLPSIVAADDFRTEALQFGVISFRRYLRVQVTASGVSSGGLVGCNAVLSSASVNAPLRTGS